MTKITIKPATISKEDLGGYSKSLQEVMNQEMSWFLSVKFSRIIRAVQPTLKEFDTDRNTVLDSVEVKEDDSQEVRRAKAKEANKRLQVLLDEEVEVYEVRLSELMQIYEKVAPSLLIGFADALIFDVDPDEVELEEEETNESS